MAKAAQMQGSADKDTILTVLDGKGVTVEDFAAENIWVVDDATFADLNRDFRLVLEPDYYRPTVPYHNPDRARALGGQKLVVNAEGTKGFVLCISEKVSASTAEGFFRSRRVIPGEKLFDRYSSPQQLHERFFDRARNEGFNIGENEPVYALYMSYPLPFSAEKITPAIAARAVARSQERDAVTRPAKPVLGL